MKSMRLIIFLLIGFVFIQNMYALAPQPEDKEALVREYTQQSSQEYWVARGQELKEGTAVAGYWPNIVNLLLQQKRTREEINDVFEIFKKIEIFSQEKQTMFLKKIFLPIRSTGMNVQDKLILMNEVLIFFDISDEEFFNIYFSSDIILNICLIRDLSIDEKIEIMRNLKRPYDSFESLPKDSMSDCKLMLASFLYSVIPSILETDLDLKSKLEIINELSKLFYGDFGKSNLEHYFYRIKDFCVLDITPEEKKNLIIMIGRILRTSVYIEEEKESRRKIISILAAIAAICNRGLGFQEIEDGLKILLDFYVQDEFKEMSDAQITGISTFILPRILELEISFEDKKDLIISIFLLEDIDISNIQFIADLVRKVGKLDIGYKDKKDLILKFSSVFKQGEGVDSSRIFDMLKDFEIILSVGGENKDKLFNIFMQILDKRLGDETDIDISREEILQLLNNLLIDADREKQDKIIYLYNTLLMSKILSVEDKLELEEPPVYLQFILKMKKIDFTDESSKRDLQEEITQYFLEQSRQFPSIDDFLNLPLVDRDLYFKTYSVLCLMFSCLSESSLWAEEDLGFEFKYILGNAKIEAQEQKTVSLEFFMDLRDNPSSIIEELIKRKYIDRDYNVLEGFNVLKDESEMELSVLLMPMRKHIFTILQKGSGCISSNLKFPETQFQKNIIDLFSLWSVIFHELGHRELFSKGFKGIELGIGSFHEAFADIKAFESIEKLVETFSEEEQREVFKSVLDYLYHSDFANFRYQLISVYNEEDLDEENIDEETRNFFVEKDILYTVGSEMYTFNKFNVSKQKFIEWAGEDKGKQLYYSYIRLLISKPFIGYEKHMAARYTLYRLFNFLQEGYFDYRRFVEDYDDKVIDVIDLLKQFNILKSENYDLFFLKFIDFDNLKDCSSLDDFKLRIRRHLAEAMNISMDSLEEKLNQDYNITIEDLEETLESLFETVLLLKQRPELVSYSQIAKYFRIVIPRSGEQVELDKKITMLLVFMGMEQERVFSYLNFDMDYGGQIIFSMSLTSDWKEIMSQKRDALKSLNKKEIFIKEKQGLGSIDNEAFAQADAQGKLNMMLQLLKGRVEGLPVGSVSRSFYDKIKDKPLDFFTQRLMPNLADTDGEKKVTVREISFKNWHVLFIEVLHELEHITGIDEVIKTGDKIKDDINKEIKNYLYLMTMMNEMFGMEVEEFIGALETLGVFEMYKADEMRSKLQEKFKGMPVELSTALDLVSDKEELSYPYLLRDILRLIKEREIETHKKGSEVVDDIFSEVAGSSVVSTEGKDLENKIKAFITINVYA
jgi:hypothetical protein